MIEDLLLTFLGFCGALCVAKIQERDSAMMQIKFQLIDELIAIDEHLHADFAKGEISLETKRMANRFKLHLLAYCKTRTFYYFKNRAILKAWNELIDSIGNPQKPVSTYGLKISAKPMSDDISEKINRLLNLLY